MRGHDDTRVSIVVQPGATVNVGKPDSGPPMAKLPRWAKVGAGVVSALVGAISVFNALWEATHSAGA